MSADGASLDFDRIGYLFDPGLFLNKRVTVVGLGSGGAPACDHLTMSGVRCWELYDPDTLDAINLIKHPRMRRDVGRYKVEIQKEWILDRNPAASVETYEEDVMTSATFAESVGRSDLVLSCSDDRGVREFVNDQCVAAGVPFVTAMVFRTGIGGEVFGCVPGRTGCYQCLQLYSIIHGLNLSDDELGLTGEETRRIYGLDEHDFRASGLSVDIQSISLIQVRMALSILLSESDSRLPPLRSNWIIYGNRPADGIFKRHFEVRRMRLKPQHGCHCVARRLRDAGRGGRRKKAKLVREE